MIERLSQVVPASTVNAVQSKFSPAVVGAIAKGSVARTQKDVSAVNKFLKQVDQLTDATGSRLVRLINSHQRVVQAGCLFCLPGDPAFLARLIADKAVEILDYLQVCHFEDNRFSLMPSPLPHVVMTHHFDPTSEISSKLFLASERLFTENPESSTAVRYDQMRGPLKPIVFEGMVKFYESLPRKRPGRKAPLKG